MSITMSEIAKLANVSTATVSKVLSNKSEHISEKTKQIIISIANENNYNLNTFARGLRTNKSGIIGFVLPDINNSYFTEIAKGIEDTASKEGFSVIFSNTNNDVKKEINCLRVFQSRMVDCIILAQAVKAESQQIIDTIKVPMVIVDRVGLSNDRVGKIYIDTVDAFKKSTEFLINAGCVHIAFIGAISGSMNDRLNGYRDALKKNNYQYDGNLIYLDEYSIDTGYEGIYRLLKNNCFDGVVCGDDLIAIGAMKAIAENGFNIPQDIKIIGFDDLYIDQFLTPPLTTIRQPSYEYGVEAVKMLIDNIKDGIPLKNKKLNIELISRGTV